MPLFDLEFSKCSYSRAFSKCSYSRVLALACGALVYLFVPVLEVTEPKKVNDDGLCSLCKLAVTEVKEIVANMSEVRSLQYCYFVHLCTYFFQCHIPVNP